MTRRQIRENAAIQGGGIRPEIQALRAIAVLSVVVYHLWPVRLPGGFVGVDIFFVISGFLIVAHLMREIDRTGSVQLLVFWARRARRLLPASLLVLAVTGLAVVVAVPTVQWQQFYSEIGASALYVQNWLLAYNAVDYLAAVNAPSPVEHFWSLSVEEQFYLAWPIVIVLLLAVGRLRRALSRRAIVVGVLVVVTAASFFYSVYAVDVTPSAAYFVTTARAWEFGAGGLLALLSHGSLGFRPLRGALVSWLGLAIIAITVFFYSAATPFPGIGAIPPVVGTLLMIWAGSPTGRWSPGALLGLRPAQWVGGVSYSLYLWHWPLIVLVPFVTAQPLDGQARVLILVSAVVLAYITKRFVEEPFRVRTTLTRRTAGRALFVTLGCTVIVALGATLGYCQPFIASYQISAAAAAAIRDNPRCAGAPAALPENQCSQPYAVTTLTTPAYAETDIGRGVQSVDECKQTFDATAVMTCDIGDLATATSTVALVGDSHAGQYLTALDEYGRANHVHFITYLKSWCAGTGAPDVASFGYDVPERMQSCTDWGRSVLASVSQNTAIDAVLFTDYTRSYVEAPPSLGGRPITAGDFETAWQPLLDAGKRVIVIRDLPNADKEDIPACVATHLAQYDPCSQPRASATLDLGQDPLSMAAAQMPSVSFIDLTDDLCDATTCHVVIGGFIVYFGSNHLTQTFSRTLESIVGPQIRSAL
ncbi:acyltransferase family protein [Subtercola frigoramans]|nr:acyltransferase family protein [Subtercola frigoramans]